MPAAHERRKPVFDPTGRVEHINKDEVKIADVRQHFFGLALIYIQIIVALALAFGLILPFLGDALESFGLSRSAGNSLSTLLALVASVFLLLYLVLATRIYNSNQLIITRDNVTQVKQIGLFNRQISEISMENVEDVTAYQSGIFPTTFNYGRLRIETAGEQNNYDFNYCPNPNAYAKAIQDARLEFIKTHA